MREDERGSGFARQAGEVRAVPGRERGGEDAGFRAEVDGFFNIVVLFVLAGLVVMGCCGVGGCEAAAFGGGRGRGGVVADAEAIPVVRTRLVEAQAGVVGLGEDAVGGGGDEVGEEDGRVARVD